jgi:hypothetical protein
MPSEISAQKKRNRTHTKKGDVVKHYTPFLCDILNKVLLCVQLVIYLDKGFFMEGYFAVDQFINIRNSEN